MKKTLLISLLVNIALCLNAQSNAAIQFSVDKNAIDLLQRKTYSSFLQNQESELLEKVGENAALVKKIYEQPLSIGLDTSRNLLGFVEILEAQVHIGVQIPLSDVALFENSLLQYARKNLLNIQAIDPNIENEQIRTALQEQQTELIARRKALFTIQEIPQNGVRLIDQGDLMIAWDDSNVFVIKSTSKNTQDRLATFNGTADEFHGMLQQEMDLSQRDYAAQLIPIAWDDFSHNIVIRLNAEAVSALNETVEEKGEYALLSLIFDETIQLEERNHQIQIDFKQEQILVELLQNDEIRKTQNWTKAALTENWEDVELVAEEDALDVWFRVLGKRFRE